MMGCFAICHREGSIQVWAQALGCHAQDPTYEQEAWKNLVQLHEKCLGRHITKHALWVSLANFIFL
jgi:hypothetical protein